MGPRLPATLAKVWPGQSAVGGRCLTGRVDEDMAQEPCWRAMIAGQEMDAGSEGRVVFTAQTWLDAVRRGPGRAAAFLRRSNRMVHRLFDKLILTLYTARLRQAACSPISRSHVS